MAKPMQEVTLDMHRKDGSSQRVPLLLRLDTTIEFDYLRHRDNLPHMLGEPMESAA